MLPPLWAEGVLVKTDHRLAPGDIVDAEDIEAGWTIADVAVGQKALRGADQDALLGRGNAQLRKGSGIFAEGARPDFDEREGLSVVTDEIKFSFDALGHVIFRDKNIAVAAEIPVAVGFTT
jgi:hypothetical protein